MGSRLSALRVGDPHLGSRVTFSYISSRSSRSSPASPQRRVSRDALGMFSYKC